jgi:hypothetical protein
MGDGSVVVVGRNSVIDDVVDDVIGDVTDDVINGKLDGAGVGDAIDE